MASEIIEDTDLRMDNNEGLYEKEQTAGPSAATRRPSLVAIERRGGGTGGRSGRNDSVRAQAEQHLQRHQHCCPGHRQASDALQRQSGPAASSVAKQAPVPTATVVPQGKMRSELLLHIGETLNNGRWTVVREIADGGFGQVFQGMDADGGEVAIKVEPPNARLPLLRHEYEMFTRLRQHFGRGKTPDHLIDVYAFGETTVTGSAYLVMSLCGENLRQLKKATAGDRFSVQTSLLITIQMIKALQQLHEAGWIHRDVKPSNFCFGKPNHPRSICLIDFGLARKYTTSDGRHRPARAYSGFHGTPRYASITTHDHQDMGRRDDLWSIFYITVENMRGQVPWRNVVDKVDVRRRKATADFAALLSGCDREGLTVIQFGEYLMDLRFDTEPDYVGVNTMFQNELEQITRPIHQALYDWEITDSQTNVGSTGHSNHFTS